MVLSLFPSLLWKECFPRPSIFLILFQQKGGDGCIERLTFFIISFFFFYYGVYLTSKTEMEKLEKLQNFKDKLQSNVSLQLIYNMDSLEKIKKLSSTLQEMATKLCYELCRKEPGNPIFLSELFIIQWTNPRSHLIISFSLGRHTLFGGNN